MNKSHHLVNNIPFIIYLLARGITHVMVRSAEIYLGKSLGNSVLITFNLWNNIQKRMNSSRDYLYPTNILTYKYDFMINWNKYISSFSSAGIINKITVSDRSRCDMRFRSTWWCCFLINLQCSFAKSQFRDTLIYATFD